jgi:hypothetical protein
MIQHRHREQFDGGDKAGKGRQPEIQPQRRQDDEHEIGQRRCETERTLRPHRIHMDR